MSNIKLKDISLSITIDNLKNTNDVKFKNLPGGEILFNNNKAKVNILKNINLEISDNSIIGIIGHNGSGKSSLLRIISGIYPPSSGELEIIGSITAIHNMSQGINPDLNGIENIYLRGYLLGMNREYIENKIEFIREFSELGEFLNLPLKTYSAGMISRLLFSINIIKKFDILLVDEGLGAGDVDFILKVRKKTRELLDESKICVYVSHNVTFLKNLGARIIELNKGKIIKDSDS
jgi:ABC-type polysaccharide/polyol phosphate transport system ATPase subunit